MRISPNNLMSGITRQNGLGIIFQGSMKSSPPWLSRFARCFTERVHHNFNDDLKYHCECIESVRYTMKSHRYENESQSMRYVCSIIIILLFKYTEHFGDEAIAWSRHCDDSSALSFCRSLLRHSICLKWFNMVDGTDSQGINVMPCSKCQNLHLKF